MVRPPCTQMLPFSCSAFNNDRLCSRTHANYNLSLVWDARMNGLLDLRNCLAWVQALRADLRMHTPSASESVQNPLTPTYPKALWDPISPDQ